jgi:acetyl esterase/lipase
MATAHSAEVITDIPYLGANRSEKLDLYLPARRGKTPSPAVVVIHGGGFTGGDKADPREKNICANLSHEGYVCASINYQLSVKSSVWASFPLNLYDVKTAIAFLRANSQRYGINPEKIGAIGGSAGGMLALLAGMTASVGMLVPPALAPSTRLDLQAIVNMYGPTDFSAPAMQAVIPTPPDLVDRVSPIAYVRPNLPPILTLHGTADAIVPVAQAYRLDDALRNIGADHGLEVIDGAPHSFHLQPAQKDLRPLVFSFFARCLG